MTRVIEKWNRQILACMASWFLLLPAGVIAADDPILDLLKGYAKSDYVLQLFVLRRQKDARKRMEFVVQRSQEADQLTELLRKQGVPDAEHLFPVDDSENCRNAWEKLADHLKKKHGLTLLRAREPVLLGRPLGVSTFNSYFLGTADVDTRKEIDVVGETVKYRLIRSKNVLINSWDSFLLQEKIPGRVQLIYPSTIIFNVAASKAMGLGLDGSVVWDYKGEEKECLELYRKAKRAHADQKVALQLMWRSYQGKTDVKWVEEKLVEARTAGQLAYARDMSDRHIMFGLKFFPREEIDGILLLRKKLAGICAAQGIRHSQFGHLFVFHSMRYTSQPGTVEYYQGNFVDFFLADMHKRINADKKMLGAMNIEAGDPWYEPFSWEVSTRFWRLDESQLKELARGMYSDMTAYSYVAGFPDALLKPNSTWTDMQLLETEKEHILRNCQRAMQRRPNGVRNMDAVGMSYYYNKHSAEAKPILERLVKENWSPYNLWLGQWIHQLALVTLKQDRFEESISWLTKEVDMFPDKKTTGYLTLGDYYWGNPQDNHLGKALEMYERYERDFPGTSAKVERRIKLLRAEIAKQSQGVPK